MGYGLNRLFFKREVANSARDVFGIRFANPVGLHSGPESNTTTYFLMGNSMYSFIGIGPLVPKTEVLKKTIASITARKTDILFNAVLTHKNESRDEDALIADYCFGLSMMYDFVDMFTVDATISNTQKSKPLQDISMLSEILDAMLQLRVCYEVYKPIIVTVSPDIPEASLDSLLDYCRMSGIDGICIAHGNHTAQTVKLVYEKTQGRFPIIASCDILKKSTAKKLADAGASLVVGGTNFLHRGPLYTKRIIKKLHSSK